MTATEIRRIKFTQVDDILKSERTQLAKDAQSKLGYKKLAQTLVIPDALMYGLRVLGIEPLSDADVEKYKDKKLKPGMWSDVKVGMWAGVVALFFSFVIAPFLNYKSNPKTLDAYGFFSVCCLIVGIIAGILSLVYMFDKSHSGAHRITYAWQRATLPMFGEMGGIVPEFVLAKALQIQKQCPNVAFQVDYLVAKMEDSPRRQPDPFLVATLGTDEAYYIEVWDEKEYERNL